jgi:hypothetical protein
MTKFFEKLKSHVLCFDSAKEHQFCILRAKMLKVLKSSIVEQHIDTENRE